MSNRCWRIVLPFSGSGVWRTCSTQQQSELVVSLVPKKQNLEIKPWQISSSKLKKNNRRRKNDWENGGICLLHCATSPSLEPSPLSCWISTPNVFWVLLLLFGEFLISGSTIRLVLWARWKISAWWQCAYFVSIGKPWKLLDSASVASSTGRCDITTMSSWESQPNRSACGTLQVASEDFG